MSGKVRPIFSPDESQRMLGTGQRGLTVVLGEGITPLRFDDGKTLSGKHVLTFDLNKPEEKLQYDTAVKSKAFDRGEIVYIESPNEVKIKARKAEQAKTLAEIRKLLKTGVFSLTQLKHKHMDDLVAFAESIGADCRYFNPKNNSMTLHKKQTVLDNIYKLLEVEEPVEEEAELPEK